MWSLREVSAVIALLVVLVCGQALAVGVGESTDKPVTVTVAGSKASTSPMKRCSTNKPKTTIQVRFQSIKSKTTSFNRVLLNMTTIETYATKLDTGFPSNIGICAEMADSGGFKGFSFTDDGLCKMFSPGRQLCKCAAGSGNVIYVRDSFWDKQDLFVPDVRLAKTDSIEHIHFPGTVVNQNLSRNYRQLLGAGPMSDVSDAVLEPQLIGMLPGFTVWLCNGTDQCYLSSTVDSKNCNMGCDSTSWTLRRLYTWDKEIIDDIAPPVNIYILSECGKTITMNNTFPVNAAGSQYSWHSHVVMSHQGYGCKWYPKEDQDHECEVTFKFLKGFKLSFQLFGLDHDTTSCAGDTILFYLENVLKDTLDGCSQTMLKYVQKTAGEIKIGFKRQAKQYISDGFNVGFLLNIQTRK